MFQMLAQLHCTSQESMLASMTNILMWSGPRNLSTAMMRSFGARGDCAVWDEPFYAPYLAATGNDHPMRAETLAAHENDAAKVSAACAAPAPDGSAHYYQKHMTHHMIDSFDLSFMDKAVNVFLLRSPERVLASYVEKWEAVTLHDIGFDTQTALFDRISQKSGAAPIVVNSSDITRAPAETLEKLCKAIGISWTPNMLNWPSGIHASDGVWAKHWYNAVEKSTGFQPTIEKPLPVLPDHLQKIADDACPHYEKLLAYAI
jgi:Sulfotransferase domain